MSDELIIGGVAMPTLKLSGLTVTKEKIWSKNTGRAANGEMIGDIITTKYTLKCSWPPLTRQQITVIDKAIKPAFFNVTFTDPGTEFQSNKNAFTQDHRLILFTAITRE